MRYQLDLSVTLVNLVDVDVPAGWDGKSFAETVIDGVEFGRDHLVLSQGAWTYQRGVRWDDWLLPRTYHDAFKSDLEDIMLFDLAADPHETMNLADREPGVVDEGLAKLQRWIDDHLLEAARDERGGTPDSPNGVTDPMWEVLRGKGPYYTWGKLEEDAAHLRETDRGDHAAELLDRRGRGPAG